MNFGLVSWARAVGRPQGDSLHKVWGQTSPPHLLWLPALGWAIPGDLWEDLGEGPHLGKGGGPQQQV